MTSSDDRYLARGPRVGIRHFTAADREEFTTLARQSAELHHPWLYPPVTDDAYDGYLARLQEPAREGFLICEHASGRIAGYLTVNNIVHGAFRCGAIGYGAFAHAAGRGLMGEGLRLVLHHAFGELGLHRLEVNIQPDNRQSIALVRRAGFRLEGFSPDFLFIDGAWRGHQRWAMTSEMLQDGTTGSTRSRDTPQPVVLQRPVPVFRIFDPAKAKEFYVGYLGCAVDWEHRFEPGTPLYTQVSRGGLVLHLSEHHGDATPGSTVYTELSGVRALHAELAAREYPFQRPGLVEDEFGTSLTLTDPFGNRLRFNEPGGAEKEDQRG
ncbi:glyoxalase superfamily protein [Streptomyces albospinus]